MREPKWYQQQNNRRNEKKTSYTVNEIENHRTGQESEYHWISPISGQSESEPSPRPSSKKHQKTMVQKHWSLWVKKTVYSTPNLKALEAIQDQYCPLEYDFYINIYYHVPIGCFFMHFHWGNPLSTNQWELEAIQPRYPREHIRKATKPMEIHRFPARIGGFHPSFNTFTGG